MPATLVITPTEVQVGDAVKITGDGFLPDTVVLVSIPEYGHEHEIMSDIDGDISSDDLADRATATLTSTGTNVTANDTVTIGAVTYTFKASVAATANEVLIGADAAATLVNLKAAINLTGGALYGSATVIHPTVSAGVVTATTLKLYAKTGGTAGNDLASTEVAVTLSFGGATFSGGAVSTGVSPLLFTPTETRPFTVKATDGTNTVSKTVQVWTQ